jgi:peptidoglycan hydrolase-like protein with peptidoglycan-binding domain
MKKIILVVFVFSLRAASAQFLETLNVDHPLFHHTDSLAARDDLGLTHQTRTDVNETDFAPRFGRIAYYGMSARELSRRPAYVGALQRDLTRLGYYCGPIDGVYSVEVSDAIAILQKNYSMRVTGTLTLPVRRALHLP